MADQEKSALFWQPDRSKPWGKIAFGGVAGLAAVGGLVFFLSQSDGSTPTAEPSTSSTSTALSATHSGVIPPPAPKPAAAPAPQPPEDPATAPKPKKNLDQCVAKHFAPDAFAAEVPAFDFVCAQADPRKIAMNLKARLVYAQQKGGPVSEAMKEWSILNWYELAFAATVVHACCETPQALHPESEICEFGPKIIAMGEAGASGKGLESAIEAFDKGIQCLINFKVAAHYKQKHPTYGPERDAFKRVSQRSLSD